MMEWLMLDGNEENTFLEESKKVPTYLNSSVHYFCNIFEVRNLQKKKKNFIFYNVSSCAPFFSRYSTGTDCFWDKKHPVKYQVHSNPNLLSCFTVKKQETYTLTHKLSHFQNLCDHHLKFNFLLQLNDISLVPDEPIIEDNSMENSSFGNSSNFATSITNKVLKRIFVLNRILYNIKYSCSNYSKS